MPRQEFGNVDSLDLDSVNAASSSAAQVQAMMAARGVGAGGAGGGVMVLEGWRLRTAIRTLDFQNGVAHPRHPYPIDGAILPHLEEVNCVGDGLMDALCQCPPTTFTELKKLDMKANRSNLNNILAQLPNLPALESCRLRPSMWSESLVETFPTIKTVASAVASSPLLVRLDTTIVEYGATVMAAILTSCPKLVWFGLIAGKGDPQQNTVPREARLGRRIVIIGMRKLKENLLLDVYGLHVDGCLRI
ncbi:hypothetical protein HDV00_004714 [Rhizophlyctis rosea]|nr:hypothetical protein HDV00_004714 [Rhizophlyctis rosea]